jgi:DNA repair exonuclease SbcCD ATPase subunit
MSVSLQQRLSEVAKEFEDQKYRQLDLYQRQLRKARDQLQEQEDRLSERTAELDEMRALAEEAEYHRSADSRTGALAYPAPTPLPIHRLSRLPRTTCRGCGQPHKCGV